MTANPADIARALSEAQRRMLIALENGQPQEFALGRTGFALIDNGLAFVNELGARHLTDLGHTVRDYLLHRPTIDASTDRNKAKVVRCGKGIE